MNKADDSGEKFICRYIGVVAVERNMFYGGYSWLLLYGKVCFYDGIVN